LEQSWLDDGLVELAAFRSEFVQFRTENRVEHLAIRKEMHAAFDEAKRHALVLHEHVIGVIKTIKEG
jgi:hypothetical protein